MLLDGAELIGIHKGRYYKNKNGLALGPGPFITMLEYATDKVATVLGKPEPMFFKTAIQSTGFTEAQCVMIGDVRVQLLVICIFLLMGPMLCSVFFN